MSKANARRGAKMERRAKKELEAAGYYVVKSARSMGIWDIWCIKGADVRLIQVKSTDSAAPALSLYAADIAKMEAADVIAQQELWVWRLRRGWEKILIRGAGL